MGLVLYNDSTDDSELFVDFRTVIAGPAVTSNFYKIDTAFVADRARLTALEAKSIVIPVSATYTSGSLYNATVAAITTYVDKQIILLKLDITNPGTTTLQINALAVTTLVKVNTAGTSVNLTANDLRPNRLNLFMYDLASTTWIWIGSTAADTINISGSSGNVVTVSANNTLDGSLTQSLMVSQTIHSAVAKTTPADLDEIGIVDSAASNVLKRTTFAQFKTAISTALGAIIAAASAKTTPIGADLLGIADTADSNNTKKVTITNLFAQFGILANAFTAKTTPAVADVLGIGDSAASFAAKKITITNLFTILGTYIDSITAKTTPVTGDELLLSDSAASFANKKVTIGNIFGVLGTFINGYTDKASPVAADLLAIADSAASFAVKKLSLTNLLVYLRSFLMINAPEGFLQNGVITPSVSSNNLTVAIKTLAGTDPSATDPVYVRINGVVRSITSALSVTKNAGTNWCSSGSSETATLEVDYFVYLGFNTTDGVVIGFSRIPYAKQYSQFSATTTANTYCAISTITNAASTDYYCNIGRFSATLSATAAFTWSVPTFTALNLINRPIYVTRRLTFTPTLTGVTTTSGTLTASYSLSDMNFILHGIRFIFGASSAITAPVSASLPFTASVTSVPKNMPAIFLDSGSGYFVGAFGANSAGGITVRRTDTTYELLADLTNLIPMTWTTNDEILVGEGTFVIN